MLATPIFLGRQHAVPPGKNFQFALLRIFANRAAVLPISSTALSFSRSGSSIQRRNCSRRAPSQVQESQEIFCFLRVLLRILPLAFTFPALFSNRIKLRAPFFIWEGCHVGDPNLFWDGNMPSFPC